MKNIFIALTAAVTLNCDLKLGAEELTTRKASQVHIFDRRLADAVNQLKIVVRDRSGPDAIENGSFRLYLEASRFQRRYGAAAWNEVKAVVYGALDEASNFLGTKQETQRERHSLQRYQAGLASPNQAQGR